MAAGHGMSLKVGQPASEKARKAGFCFSGMIKLFRVIDVRPLARRSPYAIFLLRAAVELYCGFVALTLTLSVCLVGY